MTERQERRAAAIKAFRDREARAKLFSRRGGPYRPHPNHRCGGQVASESTRNATVDIVGHGGGILSVVRCD